MAFTCKLIETALGVTTKKKKKKKKKRKKEVGAQNAILNAFKRNWLLPNDY